MTTQKTYEPFKYEAGKNFEIFKSRNSVDVKKCMEYICLILDCEERDIDNEKPYEFKEDLNILVLKTSAKLKIEIILNLPDPVIINIGWGDLDAHLLKRIAQKAIFEKLIAYEILKKEHVPYFEKIVVLGQKMTTTEVIEILCNYHRVPEKNILDAFLNLRKAHEIKGVTAIFSKGVSYALNITYLDKEGVFFANERINQYDGEPMNHIG